MNKIEAEYWERLQADERRGIIRDIGYQRITLKLGQDCRYTSDFDFVDTHGVVTLAEVKAGRKDKKTGKEQRIEIKAGSGLSDEEIQRMVSDAEANREEDKRFQELVTARNKADQLVHHTRSALKEHGGKVPGEQLGAIEEALSDLDKAMKGDDKAWAKFKRYNIQDVEVTERLLETLWPWINSPHLGQWTGSKVCCYSCGSTDLTLAGVVYGRTLAYPKMVCRCGAWSKILRNGEARAA